MDKLTGSLRLSRLDLGETPDDLARVINRVVYTGERITLQRRGKIVAALIPVEDLKFLEEYADRLRCWTHRPIVVAPRHVECRSVFAGSPVDGRRNGNHSPRR